MQLSLNPLETKFYCLASWVLLWNTLLTPAVEEKLLGCESSDATNTVVGILSSWQGCIILVVDAMLQLYTLQCPVGGPNIHHQRTCFGSRILRNVSKGRATVTSSVKRSILKWNIYFPVMSHWLLVFLNVLQHKSERSGRALNSPSAAMFLCAYRLLHSGYAWLWLFKIQVMKVNCNITSVIV